MTESKSPNICFNPQKTVNKSGYSNFIDGLLKCSMVEAFGRYVIHVADISTILKINLNFSGSSDCPISDLFEKIGAARALGITV